MPKLFITVNTDKLDVNYNTKVVSFIKDVIKAIDPIKYERLYYYNDGGTVRYNKDPKPFCLGVKPYNYLKSKEKMLEEKNNNKKLFEIEDNMMWLEDGMFTIIISALDTKFLNDIAQQIRDNKEKYKDMYGWEIKYDPVMPKDKQEIYIGKNKIKIRTITPIIVTNKEGELIDIEKQPNEFNDSLNYIMNEVFRATFGRPLKKPVSLTPIKYKIQKSVLSFNGFTKTLKGYYGDFKLEGDPEDINYMISLGIGFRRSQGYGMITITPAERISWTLKREKRKGKVLAKGKNFRKNKVLKQ